MENDKRQGERVSLKIPVKCLPVEGDAPAEQSVEIWTSDVHSLGTGFSWPLSSKPQTCPVCQTTVKDLNCLKPQCPYRAIRNVLLDSGWLQIRGLHHIPGWEKEEKVLAKVMWFRMDDDGVDFQFGVCFSREKPPIRPESAKPGKYNIFQHEIHDLDIERWKTAIRGGEKQALIVDEDKIECSRLLDFLGKMRFTGKTVSSDLAGMTDRFVENPKVIFINPVFGGKLKMEIFEKLRQAHPEALLVLLMDSSYKTEIFDNPQFHLASHIFVKPLDFDRIQETFNKI